jgi:hypothetical protein
MQRHPLHSRRQGDAQRTRPAAQIDDQRSRRCEACGLADEKLGAVARDEHSRGHRDAQTEEVGPADDVLEGQTTDTPVDHGGEIALS